MLDIVNYYFIWGNFEHIDYLVMIEKVHRRIQPKNIHLVDLKEEKQMNAKCRLKLKKNASMQSNVICKNRKLKKKQNRMNARTLSRFN